MNRKSRRTEASVDRSSPTMLRKLLAEREGELQQYRELLFSLVREHGRVRIKLSESREGDRVDVRVDGDIVVLELIAGPRAVPS